VIFAVTNYDDHDPDRKKCSKNIGKIRVYLNAGYKIDQHVQYQANYADQVIWISLFQRESGLQVFKKYLNAGRIKIQLMVVDFFVQEHSVLDLNL